VGSNDSWDSFETSGYFFGNSGNGWSGSSNGMFVFDKSGVNGSGDFVSCKSSSKTGFSLSGRSGKRWLDININFSSGWCGSLSGGCSGSLSGGSGLSSSGSGSSSKKSSSSTSAWKSTSSTTVSTVLISNTISGGTKSFRTSTKDGLDNFLTSSITFFD